jgi:AraC family transcriptional regulator
MQEHLLPAGALFPFRVHGKQDICLKRASNRSRALWMAERITGILDGQIVAATDTPLTTSATTSWSGFLLETHSSRLVRDATRWGWHRTHICLITHGECRFSVDWHKDERNFIGTPGSLYIFPRGFGEIRFHLDACAFQTICVELDPARFLSMLDRHTEIPFEPQLSARDGHIAKLLACMAAEVNDGCPTGAVYEEFLSLGLAAYLEARFSHNNPEGNLLKREFSKVQSQRLVEYILTNLNHDMSLSELANLVDMGPRQFSRLFFNTFGDAPHRYVTKERVSRAKELLANGSSFAEAAHVVGFANQSHFTRVFRRFAGAPPGRFRKAVR